MYSLSKLFSFKSGTISGPTQPIKSGQIIAGKLDESMLALFRIQFSDNELYQYRDKEGLTRFDHLVCVTPNISIFFVDTAAGQAVIGAIFNDGEILPHNHQVEYCFIKNLEPTQLDKLLINAMVAGKDEIELIPQAGLI